MPATQKSSKQLVLLSPLSSPALLPTPLPSPSSFELHSQTSKKPVHQSDVHNEWEDSSKRLASWTFPSSGSGSAPATVQEFERQPRTRTRSTPYSNLTESATAAAVAASARNTQRPKHQRSLSVAARPDAIAFARAHRRRAQSPPPRPSSPPPPVPPLPSHVLASKNRDATIIVRAARVARVTPVLLATPPSTPPSTPPMGAGLPLRTQSPGDNIAAIVDLYAGNKPPAQKRPATRTQVLSKA